MGRKNNNTNVEATNVEATVDTNDEATVDTITLDKVKNSPLIMDNKGVCEKGVAVPNNAHPLISVACRLVASSENRRKGKNADGYKVTSRILALGLAAYCKAAKIKLVGFDELLNTSTSKFTPWKPTDTSNTAIDLDV